MHFRWKAGAKKLRIGLLKAYGQCPSQASIGRILRRLQLSRSSRNRRRSNVVVRIETFLTQPTSPNRVWAVDFKGTFHTRDGKECWVLTASDLYSRYVVLSDAMLTPSEQLVRKRMTRCFKHYGMPDVIRVDNGQPFGSSCMGALGLSKLSVWWVKLGISVEYIDKGSPEQNSVHERMHGSYKREAISPPAANCLRQQKRNQQWRQYFNCGRSHDGIGGRVPDELYEASSRSFRGEAAFDYPGHWEVRNVKEKGDISWLGRRRFVGQAFSGESIGLEALEFEENVWTVWFRHLKIGELHQKDAGGMRPRLLRGKKRKSQR